jgi:hypothetical protein
VGDAHAAFDQLGALERLRDVRRERGRGVPLGLVEGARHLPRHLDHAQQAARADDRGAHGAVQTDHVALEGGRQDRRGHGRGVVAQGVREVELDRGEPGDGAELPGQPPGDPVHRARLVERLGDRQHPTRPVDLGLELSLDSIAALPLARRFEPGEPQPQLVAAVPREVAEEPELVLGPAPGDRVDRAQGAQHVAVVVGERQAGKRHHAHLGHRGVVAHERVLAGIGDDERFTAARDELGERVAQGSGAPLRPRRRQAARPGEDLLVDLDQRHHGDGHPERVSHALDVPLHVRIGGLGQTEVTEGDDPVWIGQGAGTRMRCHRSSPSGVVVGAGHHFRAVTLLRGQ